MRTHKEGLKPVINLILGGIALLVIFALLPNQPMHPGRQAEYESVYRTYVKTGVPLARPGGLASWPNGDVAPVLPHGKSEKKRILPTFYEPKNLIRNGGFDLWRTDLGFSIPQGNLDFAPPLGWRLYSNVPGIEVSESSTQNLSATPNSLKIINTNPSQSPTDLSVSQTLPSDLVSTLANKVLSISFYSFLQGTPNVSDDTGISLEICTSSVGKQENITAGFIKNVCKIRIFFGTPDQWHRFSLKVKVPQNAKSLGIAFFLHEIAGNIDALKITGVQMEQASEPSAFLPREGSQISSNLGIGGAGDDPGIYLMSLIFSKIGISDPNFAMKVSIVALGITACFLLYFFYLRPTKNKNPWRYLSLLALLPGILLSHHFIPLGSQYLVQQSKDTLPVGGIYVLSAELSLIIFVGAKIVFDSKKYSQALLLVMLFALAALLLTRRTDGVVLLMALYLALLNHVVNGEGSLKRRFIKVGSIFLVTALAFLSTSFIMTSATNARKGNLVFDSQAPSSSNQHAIWLAIYTGLGWNNGKTGVNSLGLAWDDTFVGAKMKMLSKLPKYQKIDQAQIAQAEVISLLRKRPLGVFSVEFQKIQQIFSAMKVEILFLFAVLVFHRRIFPRLKVDYWRYKATKEKKPKISELIPVVDEPKLSSVLFGKLSGWRYGGFLLILTPIYFLPVILAAPYRYYCGVFSSWIAAETFFLLMGITQE